MLKRLLDIFARTGKRTDAHADAGHARHAREVSVNAAKELTDTGNQFLALGDFDEAELLYRRALEHDPGYARASSNIGVTQEKRGRFEEALSSYRKAIDLDPHFAMACFNMGHCYQAMGELESALQCYRQAISLNPRYCDAYVNLGFVLQERCAFDEARESYESALAIEPQHPAARFNLSLLLLLSGDYARGFALYESRFDEGVVRDPNDLAYQASMLNTFAGIARWRGEPLHGKSLVVWCEQGLGDSIMMSRFLPSLAAQGAAHVAVYCRSELMRLFECIPGLDAVIETGKPLDAYDFHVPMMSLPAVAGVTLDTIPAPQTAWHWPADADIQWKARLASHPELRIGLAWAGSKTQSKDTLRSIPLAALAPLSRIDETILVSLQKGEASREIEAVDFSVEDWMDECADLYDTATLIRQLDLVISVDTSVAHLAGALGKPVWLLNRFESEWRWMTGRDDSPWYPKMRIFRQTALHDWTVPISKLALALENLVRGFGVRRP